MILVDIKIYLVIFPASITIFLAQLVGLGFPSFRNFALLDFLVLFERVALPENFNETGVNDICSVLAKIL